MKILLVCLGNICRSPLAHGIMKNKIKSNHLDWTVDSCGTGSWHIGELPDKRSIEVARKNGIDITDQRARQLSPNDFDIYDVILTMDTSNYNDVIRHAKPHQKDKIQMIMNYQYPGENRVVPDPYYDGGFDLVFEILESACDSVINKLIADET
jgi:protein-tyrosine phosphatase